VINMGWIKDRIDAEYRKHAKNGLDWSLLAEQKILASLKHLESKNKKGD